MIKIVNIAIIGPEDLVSTSYEIALKYNLNPLKLPYNNKDNLGSNVEQAIEFVKKNNEKVDGFLFTGPLPYYIVIKEDITNKNLFYFPILGTALYRILFIMKVHEKIDITNISIDTLKLIQIKNPYKELELDYSNLYINKKRIENFSYTQFINFHKSLYERKKTKSAVTAIKSIYDGLKELRIPVYRMIPTKYTMEKSFKFIEKTYEYNRIENNQIIILVININKYNIKGKQLTNLEKQQKQLAFHQELLTFSKNYLASVFKTEDHEFLLLINKGIFQEYTNWYKNIPIIYEIEKKLSISINVGIGMGNNVSEAEENARKALELSKQNNHNAFLINHEKEVIGPLDNDKKIKYELKSYDESLLKLSKKTGVSISNLTKIKSILEKINKNGITSNDLKKHLNVSLRTVNRIINKLVEGGVAKQVGLEQPISRGRPRNIYKINL